MTTAIAKAPRSTTPSMAWEVVTPEMAGDWLATNSEKNRHIRPIHVDALSRDMKAGNWQKSGEAIKFSKSGKLIDGQHRLTACIMANKPFVTLVVRGLEDEVFEVLDSGMKRTTGDYLARHGVKNANNVAGSLRAIVKYRNGWLRSPQYPTHEELLTFLNAHQDFDEVIASVVYRKMVTKLIPASMAGWLFYEFYERSQELAKHMLSELNEPSAQTSAGDPVMLLRERLLRSKMEVTKLPHLVIAAYVIKTWNALYTGQGIKMLRWTVNDDFPAIEPVQK